MSEQETNGNQIEVRAPMSGVFYSKPAPDQSPYVEEGSRLKKNRCWHYWKP